MSLLYNDDTVSEAMSGIEKTTWTCDLRINFDKCAIQIARTMLTGISHMTWSSR
jgi:hypothetical protein